MEISDVCKLFFLPDCLCKKPFCSQESPHQHGHNDAAMELINSVTGVDEEGRSRQRVLVFAAKRCTCLHLYYELFWGTFYSI